MKSDFDYTPQAHRRLSRVEGRELLPPQYASYGRARDSLKPGCSLIGKAALLSRGGDGGVFATQSRAELPLAASSPMKSSLAGSILTLRPIFFDSHLYKNRALLLQRRFATQHATGADEPAVACRLEQQMRRGSLRPGRSARPSRVLKLKLSSKEKPCRSM